MTFGVAAGYGAAGLALFRVLGLRPLSLVLGAGFGVITAGAAMFAAYLAVRRRRIAATREAEDG
jgi:hypothetical protein